MIHASYGQSMATTLPAEAIPLPTGNAQAPEPLSRPRATRAEARRQLLFELASGASGLVLAVFVWGTPHPATHRNALATGMSQPRELLQIQT
jgi:hypothetical protein